MFITYQFEYFLSCLMIVILASIITIGNRFYKQNKFQYLLESPNNYNFDSNYLDLVNMILVL